MEIQAFRKGSVVGFLHGPESPIKGGIVLTHGAGGDCSSRLLVELATCFAALGFYTLRCDLPFRQKRRFGPPFPAQALADREGIRSALFEMRSLVPEHVYLGGHSYGGRQASIVAAEGPTLADALLLLSYPLHPPRKPDELRTAHFGRLETPVFFAHGARDPFGSPEEMNRALESIRSPHKLLTFEGAGHDLRKGDPEVVRQIVANFNEFVVAPAEA